MKDLLLTILLNLARGNVQSFVEKQSNILLNVLVFRPQLSQNVAAQISGSTLAMTLVLAIPMTCA